MSPLCEPLPSSFLDVTTCPFIVSLVRVDSIFWVPLLCRRWPLLGRTEKMVPDVFSGCGPHLVFGKDSHILDPANLRTAGSSQCNCYFLWLVHQHPASLLLVLLLRQTSPTRSLCLPCCGSLLLSC